MVLEHIERDDRFLSLPGLNESYPHLDPVENLRIRYGLTRVANLTSRLVYYHVPTLSYDETKRSEQLKTFSLRAEKPTQDIAVNVDFWYGRIRNVQFAYALNPELLLFSVRCHEFIKQEPRLKQDSSAAVEVYGDIFSTQGYSANRPDTLMIEPDSLTLKHPLPFQATPMSLHLTAQRNRDTDRLKGAWAPISQYMMRTNDRYASSYITNRSFHGGRPMIIDLKDGTLSLKGEYLYRNSEILMEYTTEDTEANEKSSEQCRIDLTRIRPLGIVHHLMDQINSMLNLPRFSADS